MKDEKFKVQIQKHQGKRPGDHLQDMGMVSSMGLKRIINIIKVYKLRFIWLKKKNRPVASLCEHCNKLFGSTW
jgi:tRNA(Ile2) C34 agmatinyltransferase TiaS